MFEFFVLNIFVTLVVSLGANYLVSYIKVKGKNVATKEDVQEITRKIEEVKGEIEKDLLTNKTQKSLIYEACLGALEVIDSNFSYANLPHTPQKQDIHISKVREFHNKLILSCRNIETVQKFLDLVLPPPDSKYNLLTLLDEFRKLIRQELDFEYPDLQLDSKRTWIVSFKGSEKFDQEKNKRE